MDTDTSLQGSQATAKATSSQRQTQNEGYGRFCLKLESLLTRSHVQKLAVWFGYPPANIDQIQRSDNPSRLLVQFLDERGEISPTNISKLTEALKHGLGLGGVAAKIEEVFTKHRPMIDPTSVINAAKGEFIRQLKQRYVHQYNAVQPIPYIRDRLFCVDRVFVEGGIEYFIVDERTRVCKVWGKLNSYKDIFHDVNIKSVRRILEGEPGFGKSTLTLQIAYDWCNGIAGSVSDKYEILILLRLKQLGGVKSIFEAIKRFILPKDSSLSETDIKQILKESRSVLVILDGFNEYPEQDDDGTSDVWRIIKMKMFQKFDVLLTTRTACLPKGLASQTKRIQLTGFDDRAQDEYIRKAVVGDEESAVMTIKRRLLENSVLADLCQVPLFFVMFAHMSHESEHLQQFKSVTSFFSYMIKCFHHPMKNKMRDVNVLKYDSFEGDHSELDKVAFEGLCKENQQLIWEKEEFCKRLGEDFYHQYVRLGILVEEDVLDIKSSFTSMVASNLIQEKTEVRFYHNLFCEWYAAHYLSSYVGRSLSNVNNILKDLDPYDLQYVFRFACGLNPNASDKIIEHLKNTKNAHHFAILCILEKEGKIDSILHSVRALCFSGVRISDKDTLLLQRSTIQLLDVATNNQISISVVWLDDCFSTVDLRGGNYLQLKSNLSIPVLTTLNTLEIRENGREITSAEFTGILQYSSKCLALRELWLWYCLLPPSVQAESVSVLRSRNVKVIWGQRDDVLYHLNLQSCLWESSIGNYDRLKEDIILLLQKEDCSKLAEFFKCSKRQLEKIKNSDSSSKAFVFTLEENGIIHPSNVSQLKDALATFDVNPDCYRKVLMYQKTITEITLYERFVSELSSYIDASTAKDLCDYFEISNERKNNIISSQNPGHSLLFALDEIAAIKPTDTTALEYPLRHLPLVQALAKLHEYQSTISAKDDDTSSLFVECLRKKLKHLYEAMTPVPWKKSCKWKSSDLFVGSGLILKDFQSTRTPSSIDKVCKLQYTEIFSHTNLVSEKRIILKGDPGCGKTMLTAQLAYDWTQGKLPDVDILIWLPLKFVNDKTLVESIREFYIPESTQLLEDDMVKVLSSESKVIAVLLDGLEEYNCSINEGDESEVVKVFKGNKHTNWKVVLTSRSDYAHDLPVCPRLEVGSFGNDERSLYIQKVCDGDLTKQNKIETTINDNPFMLDLCRVPLLFVLAVHNIEAVESIKEGFERVGPFMKSMISTLIVDKTLAGKIVGPGPEYSSSGPMHLGEVAFNGLCMGRQQLLWQRQFLESNIDNLRDWIDSGIIVIEGIYATTTLNEDTESRKGQVQTFSKEAMLEDGGDVSEQEEPLENTYPEFKANEKNVDEQQMQTSQTLGTSLATRDEYSLEKGLTEETVPSSEMRNQKTEKETGNISGKHVPQGAKFLHKVIQEWFAATYFSYMMKKCRSKLQYANFIFEHLFLLDPTDLHYVLKFLCFLHPPFCHTIMTHLLQNYRSKGDGKVPDYIQNCIFLCFAEHNGTKGTDIAQVVSDVCKEEIVIYSQDSRLLQQAKATMLKYASNSKITIGKVLFMDAVKDVTEYGMILSSGARMAILDTLQTVEVSSWNPQLEGRQLQDIVEFLSRSQQIMEIVCTSLHPPPSNLKEETKTTLHKRKIMVKWRDGKNFVYTYSSRKGEWMAPVLSIQKGLLPKENRMSKYHGAERINPLEASAVVGKHGCVLRIPGTFVALCIPPNAFNSEDEDHNVTLRILPHQFTDETSFEDLSTVMVEILPNKLTLLEDARLILPHCLEIQNPEECRVQVFQSHHDPGIEPLWKDITQSVSYTLRESFCEIFVQSFCWVKYEVSTRKKVKAKKIVVYATGDVPGYKRNNATIEVGYHADLPGENKIFLENKKEIVVTHNLLFLKKPQEGLDITLTGSEPTCWKPDRSKNMITYLNIANSIEMRYPFNFNSDQSNDSPLSCSFKVAKGGETVELCIILEHKDARTVTRHKANDGRVVTDSHCRDISKKLLSREWRFLGRCLNLDELVIDHVSANYPNDVREMAYQMLKKWKQIKGQEASYEVLEKALRETERDDLADTLSTL